MNRYPKTSYMCVTHSTNDLTKHPNVSFEQEWPIPILKCKPFHSKVQILQLKLKKKMWLPRLITITDRDRNKEGMIMIKLTIYKQIVREFPSELQELKPANQFHISRRKAFNSV